jgi:hypothetical protein
LSGRVTAAALVAILGLAPAAASARWSAPARPAGCSTALATATPLVVFPSADPTTRSGPGALLWSAPRGCVVGAAAGEAVGATLAGDDLPGRGRALAAGADNLAEVLAATGTAAGQVLAAGAGRVHTTVSRHTLTDGGGGFGALAEGKAVGAFVAAQPLAGPAAPVAVSSSYLGDVAIASSVSTRAGWRIAVRVQRHYDEAPGPVRLVPAGPGPLTAVAAAMDYRAELLLVWVSGGEVYARELSPSGVAQPTQRLGSIEAGSSVPELRALLSDDGRAIVAWRSQSAASGGTQTTTVTLNISGAALAFGAPRPLERFRDPGGFVPPAGSLRLLRLSSEAVMMAWTALSAGHYVVRASPVSLRRGAWAPVVISGQTGGAAPGLAGGRAGGSVAGLAGSTPARSSDAVLADLAAGPDAEAFALWRVASRLRTGARPPGRAGSGPWAIRAARGHYAGQGEVSFGAPEIVAPAGPNGPPAGAVDPATGRALAAWVTLVGAPHIEYALRPPNPLPVTANPATAIPSTAIPSATAIPSTAIPSTTAFASTAIPSTAFACCLGLPYASIDSSAIRIGTPLAACLK